jgi:hypothetical protein
VVTVVVPEVVGVVVCEVVMVVVWVEVTVEVAEVVGVVRSQLTKVPSPNELMALFRVLAIASQLSGTLKSPPMVQVIDGDDPAR